MNVVIFGAGPAGMSCANALLSFGLKPVVIEKSDHLGGVQRTNFHPNLWMLGTPEESGMAMTERMARHFEALPVPVIRQAALVEAARGAARFQLRLATPEGERSLEAEAMVLATGMQPRATPELEALAQRSERVIIGPLSFTIRDGIRDSRVLILGGGDNAFDHALFLAERGNLPMVCARGRFSARRQFQEACAAHPEIILRAGCKPLAIRLREKIVVEWEEEKRAFDWLLVMYGYQPNTGLLERFAPDIRPGLTAGGHIHVDLWQRTSVPGLYAAGDITDSPQPSVVTAIAQGLAAARAVERDLHASDG